MSETASGSVICDRFHEDMAAGVDGPVSVGRPLPGNAVRIVDDNDAMVAEGGIGRLQTTGATVFRAYLDNPEANATSFAPDGWFDTGDLAEIDAEGFLTITGRVKRFAKIGGEMVSLDRVAKRARALWTDADHAVLAVRRDEGGEAIVLVTDTEEASREAFSEHVKAHDLDRRLVPEHVLVVEETPMMPTGSPDYPRLRELVREELGREPAS